MKVTGTAEALLVLIAFVLGSCGAVETNVLRCTLEDGGVCDGGTEADDDEPKADKRGEPCMTHADCESAKLECGANHVCRPKQTSN